MFSCFCDCRTKNLSPLRNTTGGCNSDQIRVGRLVIRRFESRLNLLFFVVSWPRPPTRAFYHSIKLLKRRMCELLHQSLLFESQLTLLFSVTYFRCFSMTDVPAVLKVILCHFSRNDLTLYIYYSLEFHFIHTV